MLLQKLVLHDFRNRGQEVIDLSEHLTIFLGENARGKTNLLEAVYFLINGVGFRESREEELLQIGKNEAYVEGRFVIEEVTHDFKIHLMKKETVVEKAYFLHRTRKKHSAYMKEQTKAILFSPEQIEIVNGSPDVRRTYFNKIISFYDYDYKIKLLNLENALRRRNKIFDHTRDEKRLLEELAFWNTYIEEQAKYITQKRVEYCAYLNDHGSLDHKEFGIKYLKNEATAARFAEVFEEEKRWRRTLIGPQKDDFQICLKGPRDKNIHHFGSRSEQRLGVFWLKMNEITYYEGLFKRKPILLLDDVFSEFDHQNKIMIVDLIKKYQTLLTTTEEEMVEHIDIPKTIIKV